MDRYALGGRTLARAIDARILARGARRFSQAWLPYCCPACFRCRSSMPCSEIMSRVTARSMRARMLEQSLRPPPNPVGARGEARYEITLRMSGAFGAAAVFANPLLRGILAPLLGGDMQLNSFTTVTSYPGAPMQDIHRDHGHLFANEPDVGPSLPVYAVNVAVPLIDVDLETGPTGVWPGSHRWPSNVQAQARGHRARSRSGAATACCWTTAPSTPVCPTKAHRVRPVLYMVYARGWFFDDANHFGVNTPDMSLEDYQAVPATARMPLRRALSQALRNQTREVERNARAAGPARNAERSVELGQGRAQRPVPVWLRQEVQAVPRARGLEHFRDEPALWDLTGAVLFPCESAPAHAFRQGSCRWIGSLLSRRARAPAGNLRPRPTRRPVPLCTSTVASCCVEHFRPAPSRPCIRNMRPNSERWIWPQLKPRRRSRRRTGSCMWGGRATTPRCA